MEKESMGVFIAFLCLFLRFAELRAEAAGGIRTYVKMFLPSIRLAQK